MKIHYCPRCNSDQVFAGHEVIDKHFGILQVFAGCGDCNARYVNVSRL